MTNFLIRQASLEDFSRLGEVMFKAVREADSPYSAAQREAWMPRPRAGEDWNKRLGAQYVLLAEQGGTAKGFMSLAPMAVEQDGYVDFAYILAPVRGQGLFRKLYEKIEAAANAQKKTHVFTHASLMAAPAFAKMGFDYLEKEEVEIGGEMLPRFHMRKGLSSTLV